MNLYHAVIDQRDGERVYSHNLYVVCDTHQEANAWARQELLDWFNTGDDEDYIPSIDDAGEVWDSTNEVCAHLAYVTLADAFYASDLEGNSIRIRYEVPND